MELVESLEICERMWRWLANHPARTKENAITLLCLPHMYNDCTCCDYVDEEYPCEDDCPTFGMWGTDSTGDNSCLNKNSPFQRWERAKTSKTKAKYATAIADAAAMRLKDFDYRLK